MSLQDKINEIMKRDYPHLAGDGSGKLADGVESLNELHALGNSMRMTTPLRNLIREHYERAGGPCSVVAKELRENWDPRRMREVETLDEKIAAARIEADDYARWDQAVAAYERRIAHHSGPQIHPCFPTSAVPR